MAGGDRRTVARTRGAGRLSYVALFEAFYRGAVSVVAPIVATESLFGVVFAALLLGRSERIGPRIVLGAALVVVGGALIAVFR